MRRFLAATGSLCVSLLCNPKAIAFVAWASLVFQTWCYFSPTQGSPSQSHPVLSYNTPFSAAPPNNPLAVPKSEVSFSSFGKLALTYASARRGTESPLGDYRGGFRYFEAAAPTPFWMVLPHSSTRVAAANVNTELWESGHWDIGSSENKLAAAVFFRYCTAKNKRSLVVDVGSNTGWYSALAIAHGCRTITVDGAKDALLYFSATVQMNDWMASTKILNRVVSSAAPDTFTFDGWNTRPLGAASDPSKFASQTPERLDTIIGGEEVVYLKIDVEGHEPQVFESGGALFGAKGRQILNVMFEFTYKLFGDSLVDQYHAKVWKPLWGAGYSCHILGSSIVPLSTEAYTDWVVAALDSCKAEKHCGVNVWCTLHDMDLAQS